MSRVRALTVAEVERILDPRGMDRTPVGIRDRALLEVMYGTGGRLAEIVRLDLDDVDLQAGNMRISRKNGAVRLMPLRGRQRRALAAYLSGGRAGLLEHHTLDTSHALFLSTDGGRLSRQEAWAAVEGAFARVDLVAQAHAKALRHSFAQHKLDGGATPEMVRELLGTSRPEGEPGDKPGDTPGDKPDDEPGTTSGEPSVRPGTVAGGSAGGVVVGALQELPGH